MASDEASPRVWSAEETAVKTKKHPLVVVVFVVMGAVVSWSAGQRAEDRFHGKWQQCGVISWQVLLCA